MEGDGDQRKTDVMMMDKEVDGGVSDGGKLRHLEASISIMLCKLEMVFPPSMFDSMEHFPVHLAYEAKVGGPQQYRWMYPFESYFSNWVRSTNPSMLDSEVEQITNSKFPQWFRSYFVENPTTRSLSYGAAIVYLMELQ
ncbi:hypothetical protein K1719_009272 [Acacia pycnantha]|nr:hypothetical protein K1719_009272 [Acacia pycnantha]